MSGQIQVTHLSIDEGGVTLSPDMLEPMVIVSNVLSETVRRYVWTEALNAIPEVVVEVRMLREVDVDVLLGQPAVLSAGAAFPDFAGVVRWARLAALSEPGRPNHGLLTLSIVPRLWLTNERSGHRIFQDRTTLEIVSDLLEPYGAEMEKPEGVLFQHPLKKREYRVQCGESDREFLFRLLAEEGLVSCFSPNSSGQILWVVTDDTTAGSPDLDVPYRPGAGALSEAGTKAVLAVAREAQLAPSTAHLRDYTHAHPSLRLDRECHASGSGVEEPLSRYSFAVGRFADSAEGEQVCARRLQQARSRRRTVRWETSMPVRPGTKVRLREHPHDEANGVFLVVAARSEVGVTHAHHIADVVPAEIPWRPDLPPKPRIHGTQTAFVVGAPGKEIDVDADGRVAVRFHWDTRPEGASRRVRVAMPWAGRGRGFWTLPRVGDEVVIGYLDGDPDEPLVLGSVNNAIAPTMFPLPEFEARSGWVSRTTPGGEGFNYIVMDDVAGKELLALRAERDFHSDTGRNSLSKIGGSAALSVAQGHSVEIGGDTKIGVKGRCDVEAGEVVVTTKGDINLNANGGRNDSAETFHYIGAPCVYVAGRNEVQVTAQDAIRLTVGSSSITIADGKITIVSPLIELNP